MSHIVSIKTRLQDPAAIAAACRRLGLAEPVQGTARLFSGEAAGLLVRLPGWAYPAVVEAATGRVRYDNYGGGWGDPAQLGRFLQAYSLEKARIEAHRKGYAVAERALAEARRCLAQGRWRRAAEYAAEAGRLRRGDDVRCVEAVARMMERNFARAWQVYRDRGDQPVV